MDLDDFFAKPIYPFEHALDVSTEQGDIQVLWEQIKVGQAIQSSPILLGHIIKQAQYHAHVISHIPSGVPSETVLEKVREENAKIRVYEYLYRLAKGLPQAMEQYNQLQLQQQSNPNQE